MTCIASSIALPPSPDLHRLLHAAVQVVLEQLEPERVERRAHRGHLRQDVDAVAVLVEHAADAAHLALDAVEALHERGALRHRVRGRRGPYATTS